jgi:hypothetical protein
MVGQRLPDGWEPFHYHDLSGVIPFSLREGGKVGRLRRDFKKEEPTAAVWRQEADLVGQ